LEIFMAEPGSADVGPPPAVLALLEVPRALAEYVGFVALTRLLSAGREGHGRPVLVLPGLLADDRSTRPLRRLLNSAGYAAYGWRLGTNIGPTRRIISGMDAVLAEITDRHGEPASLIGWSLGGMLAHDIAGRRPAVVDRLITLGSPLYSTDPSQSRGSPFYDEYAAAHLPE
jgi:pimeloyl-ACP methyl ester carboxylesterase